MAIAGDPRGFADFFPDGLVDEMLETLLVSWEKMPKPPAGTIETKISRRYGQFIRAEKDRRELPFRVSVEDSLTHPVTYAEAGRIDLSLHPVGSNREALYFALEAKRLRVRYDSGLHANTAEYTGKEGMLCFISGQYAAAMPQGGMVAYVMDGNVAAAKVAVRDRILKEAKLLCLPSGGDLVASRHKATEARLAESAHQLKSGPLLLHHLFLPL